MVVPRGVCEHWPASRVTGYPNTWHPRGEVLVDLNRPFLADADTDNLKAEIVRIGTAASCQEEMRACNRHLLFSGFENDPDPHGIASDRLDPRIETKCDSFRFKNPLQCGGD